MATSVPSRRGGGRGPRVLAAREEVLRAVDVAAFTLVRRAALETVREVKRLMRDPKHGVHWPGLPRRSSAPGEAPAIQSGRLIGAVDSAVFRGSTGGWEAVAGVRREVDYAVGLEFGTTRIAPRPAWRPAVGVALARMRELGPREARLTARATLRGRLG